MGDEAMADPRVQKALLTLAAVAEAGGGHIKVGFGAGTSEDEAEEELFMVEVTKVSKADMYKQAKSSSNQLKNRGLGFNVQTGERYEKPVDYEGGGWKL